MQCDGSSDQESSIPVFSPAVSRSCGAHIQPVLFMTLLTSSSSPALETLEQQVVIRITTPWYRALPVEADVFGAYNVQFAATLDGNATRLSIAAFPEVTKKFRDSADREICPLSGSFEHQS